MEGVNRHTIWTWNAIGKRAGAWNLAEDAPEATKGFLLNHLIDELLPSRRAATATPSADPVTGQAAWYDLRVRIEKAEASEAAEIVPRFAPLKAPPGALPVPPVLRYGAKFHAKTGDGR